MATAEELLAEVLDGTSDSITVDSNLRVLVIPESIQNLGVESDEEVLDLKFSLPRYYGRNDLTEFKIKVMYINAQGEEDAHEVKNSVVDEDSIAFVWTVGRHTAVYRGDVIFALNLRKLFGHIVLKEFNTTVATLPILEGLQTGEAVVQNHADILEQWRIDLFGIGDSEVEKMLSTSESQQALVKAAAKSEGAKQLAIVEAAAQEAIDAKDYVAAIVAGNEAYTKYESDTQYAPLVVEDTSGEAIAINDASGFPLQGMKTYGKSSQVSTTGAQLIPFPYFNGNRDLNGITWTHNTDGSIIVAGTSTAKSVLYFTNSTHIMAAGTYTISGSTDDIAVRIDSTDASTGVWAAGIAISTDGEPVTFTLSEEDVTNYTYTIYASVESGHTVNTTLYPMLNKGDSAVDWEPYTGGIPGPNPNYPQEIESTGKKYNLFNAYAEQVGAYNDSVATISDDGATITATGMWYTKIACSLRANMKYIFSFSIESYTVNRGVRFEYVDGSLSTYTYNSSFNFIPTQEITAIYFYSGNETSGTSIYKNFMIIKGNTTPGYFKPYIDKYELDTMIHGKNLLRYPFETVSGGTSNGLTFTCNEEGHITINGTATAATWFPIKYNIPITPGVTYTLSGFESSYSQTYMYIHVDNVNYLDYGAGVTFTVKESTNCAVHLCLGNGVTFTNAIIKPQLEIGSAPTSHEPYTSQLLRGTNDIAWGGLPVTSGGNYADSNGQQYIADYRDWKRGVDVQRVNTMAFNGTENWLLSSYGDAQYLLLTLSKSGLSDNTNRADLCTHAKHTTWCTVNQLKGNDFFVCPHAFFSITQGDITYASADDWKAFLVSQYEAGTPVTIQYILATPIEISIPEAELAAYRALRTNKTNTTIVNDSNAHMEVAYAADTKTYIDNKFAELKAAITGES